MDKYRLLRAIFGDVYFARLQQKRVTLTLDTAKKQIKVKPKAHTRIALVKLSDEAMQDAALLHAQIVNFNKEFSRYYKK